jgi:gluconolactonase
MADGQLIFTELWRSCVSTWTRERGAEMLVYTGGAPNAVVVCTDGSLIVTQNGGRERTWRARDPRAPSLQYIGPDLKNVTVLVSEIEGVPLSAPNDLAFGADGTLYFTDPVGEFSLEGVPPGYLFAVAPDGSGTTLYETGPTFPNGIAVDRDGSIVWVESLSRAVNRLLPSGNVDHICILPDGVIPDGLAIATNGDLYIMTVTTKGVTIVSPQGNIKGRIEVGLFPTNCAFRGSTLYVADGGLGSGNDPDPSYSGGLYAVQTDGVEGLALFTGKIS